MNINYVDYVFDSCDELFKSEELLTHPYPNLSVTNYSFDYKVVPDLDKISEQASHFSAVVLSSNSINSKLYRTQKFKDSPSLVSRVRDSYIYSFLRTIFYIKRASELGIHYSNLAPTNSLVFYGHYKLFLALQEPMIRTSNPSRKSTLTKTLVLDDEYLDNIKENEVWKRSTKLKGMFFDLDLENTLIDINDNYSSIKLINLSNKNLDSHLQPRSFPLGNVCFKDNFILTVPLQKEKYDPVSRFWNTANCIVLNNESKSSSENSIYFRLPISKVSDMSVDYEVQSITGISLYTFNEHNEDSDKPSGSKGSNPKDPKSGGSNPRPDKPKDGDGNSKPSLKQKSTPSQSKVNKAAKSVGKAVTDVLKDRSIKQGLMDFALMHFRDKYNNNANYNQIRDIENNINNMKITTIIDGNKKILDLGVARIEQSRSTAETTSSQK